MRQLTFSYVDCLFFYVLERFNYCNDYKILYNIKGIENQKEILIAQNLFKLILRN